MATKLRRRTRETEYVAGPVVNDVIIDPALGKDELAESLVDVVVGEPQPAPKRPKLSVSLQYAMQAGQQLEDMLNTADTVVQEAQQALADFAGDDSQPERFRINGRYVNAQEYFERRDHALQAELGPDGRVIRGGVVFPGGPELIEAERQRRQAEGERQQQAVESVEDRFARLVGPREDAPLWMALFDLCCKPARESENYPGGIISRLARAEAAVARSRRQHRTGAEKWRTRRDAIAAAATALMDWIGRGDHDEPFMQAVGAALGGEGDGLAALVAGELQRRIDEQVAARTRALTAENAALRERIDRAAIGEAMAKLVGQLSSQQPAAAAPPT